MVCVSLRAFSLVILGLIGASCSHADSTAPTGSAGATSGGNTAGGANGNETALAPAPAPVCTQTGTTDVNVTITSKQGPSGGAPVAIDNRLTSMNVDDRLPATYTPTPQSGFTALLKALKPAYLRWPPGNHGQQLIYSATNSGSGYLTPSMIDAFMALCKAVGAQPVLSINIETGSVDQAVALVTYVNKTKGYNVTWWQIGNEPDLNGVTTTASPSIYGQSFAQFQSALRAVDGNIKFVGAELMTGNDMFDSSTGTGWLPGILSSSAAAPMDAIAWHYYPLDSHQTLSSSSATLSAAHLLQESASDWPPAGLSYVTTLFPQLVSARNAQAPKAQMWIDEFAEDSGTLGGSGVADRNVGALWAVDAMGRSAEAGANAIFRFVFQDADMNAYALLDPNTKPRPEYHAYWLWANGFGDSLVKAQSDNISQVAAHAAVASADGSLRVFLVNKATTIKKVRLNLADFAPKRSSLYLLVGGAQDATDMAINGINLTADNIAQGVAPKLTTDACTDNILSLPPTSVSLYQFGLK